MPTISSPSITARLAEFDFKPETSFAKTSDKAYEQLHQYINVTSYSILNELHACPRKFQLIKQRARAGGGSRMNVDFSYGHAVGAGVQSWLVHKDLDLAIFNAMMAWRLPYEAESEKKKKSLWNAIIAVQKYVEFHEQQLENWELFTLESGKPAIELSFAVDFENGYKHYVHIDAVLRNKITGQLAIQENKTSGFKEIEEALYANSSQALSYAVLVDQLQIDSSYEVFYAVYSSVSREWQLLPFTKNSTLRAEWITDVRLDHAMLNTYRELKFFPKRGEACYSYMRRCEFFGECNLVDRDEEHKVLPDDEQAEEVDFSFTLSELIAQQQKRI